MLIRATETLTLSTRSLLPTLRLLTARSRSHLGLATPQAQVREEEEKFRVALPALPAHEQKSPRPGRGFAVRWTLVVLRLLAGRPRPRHAAGGLSPERFLGSLLPEKAEVAGPCACTSAAIRTLECRGQVEAFVVEALGVMHRPQGVASEPEEGLRRRCIHMHSDALVRLKCYKACTTAQERLRDYPTTFVP